VLKASTFDGEAWLARFGRLIDKRPSDQQGILYDTLVNTVRGEIPPNVTVIHDKATSAVTGGDRQLVKLSKGEEIDTRLIVLAHGLNLGFAHGLGLTREELSPDHSITIGFDVTPVGRPAFDFPALNYYPERARDRLAYLTLFPVGKAMRANFMVYRDMRDPWLKRMRETPKEAILEVMPRLTRILGDFAVTGFVKIRPATLYVTEGVRQPGIVLVGDAYATSCPAAGTGTSKVFTDVERLCNVHIPNWLATDGMDAAKIAAFYDDPEKRACDAMSIGKAWSLKSISVNRGPAWLARRWMRFLYGTATGIGRRFRQAPAAAEPPYAGEAHGAPNA
jgi:2-polyprenyl-6-methoxyphenol hydroxylase-like FAD-dependent oxidoreductase